MDDCARATMSDTPSLEPILEPILEVRHLHKVHGAQRVLDDVSFALHRAEMVALVGASGSGKSTLARIIARLQPASGGEVRLRARDVLAQEPGRASLAYRAGVQMVFQDPFASLNPVHTVLHHLARPLLRHRRVSGRAAVMARAAALLADVGLAPPSVYLPRLPRELSGGQRQRVAIARALAVEPEVVVADEPTSMLDVSLRAGVLALLARLKQERGLAILLITHDLASACTVADRVLVLHEGQIVEAGRAADLVRAPVHPYTRRLLAAVPDPRRLVGSPPP
jgi:ABC-type glutathione transport system ATPase component